MGREFMDLLLPLSWGLLGFVLLNVLFLVSLSFKHHARHKRWHPKELKNTPFVSVIVPCYNESKTLANCIQSLLDQSYTEYEIIIVNDGSTDTTPIIARRFAREYRPRIRLINKSNGGKASALNRGIARSRGEIIVCVDADSIFLKNTVEQLVLSFHNPEVAAVGGNVKVANRKHILSRQQSLEYITGLTLQRKAFAQAGCMQVIAGAIGAFRRDALIAVGGYSGSTVVEDMDLTIEFARHGYLVVYNPSAIAYTEAPESLKDFLDQRFRWTYGSFQVLTKHRRALLRPQASSMGLIGLPYFLIAPWLQLLISMILIISVYYAVVTGDIGGVIFIPLVMAALQTTLIAYALIADKEDKKLIFLVLVDCFIYYQLISFITVKAGVQFLRKRQAEWNKLERYGKNEAPIKYAATKSVNNAAPQPILVDND